MEYLITAKATRYKDITFRSQLEARCYDYLLIDWPETKGYHIEYEPDIPMVSPWNPDFGIYSDGFLVALVEVKPDSRMFNAIQYIIVSDKTNECPEIICMNDLYQVIFNEFGGFRIIPHDEIRWKQTFNKVKNDMYEQL